MARLNTVDPASATGRAKEIFDGPLKGKHLNIFKGMANSGAMLDAYLGLAGALGKSSLSAAEQEVIHLAISEQNNCGYCVAAHTMLGTNAGLTEEQTVEARKGHMGDAKLGALANFALALHEKKGFVTDEDLAKFKGAGYDDAGVCDAITTYALAIMTNYFNHVNDTSVDFPPAPAL